MTNHQGTELTTKTHRPSVWPQITALQLIIQLIFKAVWVFEKMSSSYRTNQSPSKTHVLLVSTFHYLQTFSFIIRVKSVSLTGTQFEVRLSDIFPLGSNKLDRKGQWCSWSSLMTRSRSSLTSHNSTHLQQTSLPHVFISYCLILLLLFLPVPSCLYCHRHV